MGIALLLRKGGLLRHDLEEWLGEFVQADVRDYMRLNLFANTPDILHEYLQKGGRPAFEARLETARGSGTVRYLLTVQGLELEGLPGAPPPARMLN